MGFDPTNQSLTGLALARSPSGCSGVLAITGEYSSGTIRSSLAATPRRPVLLGAKAIVVGLVSLVVGEVLTFACFADRPGRPVGPGSDGHPRPTGGAARRGAHRGLPGPAGSVRPRPRGDHPPHGGGHRHLRGGHLLVPILLQPLSASGNPARFAPEQILANSVAAVVPQSGQVTRYRSAFLLMVLYCAVVSAAAMMLLIRAVTHDGGRGRWHPGSSVGRCSRRW